MPAIITNKFRIHNAAQFVEGFGEAANTIMYLGIGRPQPWANEKSPDAPIDTLQQEYQYWDDMLALKRIQASDVTQAVIRRNWANGKYYDAYRHDYDGSAGQGVDIDTGSPVPRANLFEANFYVITDEYNVYKCIDNRDSTNAVVPSIVQPTGRSTSIITTGDGYQWKYMYTISPADVIKFASTDFMPVKQLASNPGASDAYIDQWLVQDAAVAGTIDRILVTNAGGSYTSAPVVSILGDGTGASANAVIDLGSGEITAIEIVNPGSGYTHATIQLSAGGGGAGGTAIAIISPQDGHGANPVEELGGYYAMMNCRLEYADGAGDFTVWNDYRRIMVVKEPTNYGSSVIATNSTLSAVHSITVSAVLGTFLEDEQITGGTSGAVGDILDMTDNGDSTITIRYTQLRGDNPSGEVFAIGEEITGNDSGASATVDSKTNPEVEHYSGDIIYVENRRAINRADDQIEDIKIIVEM